MTKRGITIGALAGAAASLALAVPAVAAPSFTFTTCHPTGRVQTIQGTYVTFQARIDDCVTRYLGGGLVIKPRETLRLVIVSSTPK